jgi:hypothetical protein
VILKNTGKYLLNRTLLNTFYQAAQTLLQGHQPAIKILIQRNRRTCARLFLFPFFFFSPLLPLPPRTYLRNLFCTGHRSRHFHCCVISKGLLHREQPEMHPARVHVPRQLLQEEGVGLVIINVEPSRELGPRPEDFLQVTGYHVHEEFQARSLRIN